MKLKKVLPITAMLLIALVWGCNKDAGMSSDLSSSNLKAGALPVNLGVAGEFVILSKSGITDVYPSVITGNIGTSPYAGSGILVACDEVTGTIYAVDANYPDPTCTKVTIDDSKLGTAVDNMLTAYNEAMGRAFKADANHLNLGSGEIGGLTLTPGVYHWDAAYPNVTISSNLTLKGGPNDVFIFQIPGTLTVASDVNVILSGGAQAGNVFWAVADVVALGTGSHFEGNILSVGSNITMFTGASINGRLLSQFAVVLQKATVTQVAQTKKACEGILNAEKTVFDAGQKAAKLEFDSGQKAAKLAFQLTHPTAADLKAFTVAQEAAKHGFEADQKTDKLAFTLQQKIDKAQCSMLQ